MRIIIFVLFISFIFCVGKYYVTLLNRAVKKETKKLQIIFYVFSFFLAFCTINVFSTLGIFLVHFLVFSIIVEGINFLVSRLSKKEKNLWKKLYTYSIISILLTVFFFTYGFINIRNIKETSYEIATTKNITEKKILFLSDSHYGKVLKKSGLEKLKENIEKEEFDLFLLGGDIIDENTTKEEMEEIFSIFGSIKTKLGTYFIYGNHDRQKYTKKKAFTEEELEETIRKNKIEILKDETKILGDIVLIGREDLGTKRKSIEELLTKEEQEKFVIVVDHQPVEYNNLKKLGVDLVLSGHTHAGQIFPAGYFIKWFHMSDLWYGYEKRETLNAIVSSGLSGWGYPIRTQEHSEYVIVNIRKEG